MRSAALALILGAGVALSAAAEPPITVRVTGIFPSFARPQGGEIVTITGDNFRNGMRVFFDQKEALVISTTPTTLQVLTPFFDLGVGQSRVTIGGTPAQVIRVSDSKIVAFTSPFATGCSDRVAPIEITNIDSGDSVNGASYTYVAPHPAFVSLPELRAGEDVTIKIANAATLGGKLVIGRRTLTIHLPANLASCGAPLQTTLTFTDRHGAQ